LKSDATDCQFDPANPFGGGLAAAFILLFPAAQSVEHSGLRRRANPPLRCSGKDANRTPPECVVPGLPQARGERSFRRRKTRSPASLARGLEAGGLQRGRAIGKMNEVGPVTANAMAELTHGDFLSKAPAGVLIHSQARR